MTIDLTPAISLSTMAGYGLARARGIPNTIIRIRPAGTGPHSTEARDQFSDRAEIVGAAHDKELRTQVGPFSERAGINGGHGSEHFVEVRCTADEAVTTAASPLGELGRTAHVPRAPRAI